MLMERFQLSLDAMVSEEFLEAVKKTQATSTDFGYLIYDI